MWEKPLAFPAPHHNDPNQMLVNFPLRLWLSFRAWSASVSSGDWPPTVELVRFCVSSLEGLTRAMTSNLPVRLGSCVLSVLRGYAAISKFAAVLFMPWAASWVMRKFCSFSGTAEPEHDCWPGQHRQYAREQGWLEHGFSPLVTPRSDSEIVLFWVCVLKRELRPTSVQVVGTQRCTALPTTAC